MKEELLLSKGEVADIKEGRNAYRMIGMFLIIFGFIISILSGQAGISKNHTGLQSEWRHNRSKNRPRGAGPSKIQIQEGEEEINAKLV